MDRIKNLLSFMEDTIDYFLMKIKDVNRDRYFADRDIRNILDKTINDIILCMVDIAEECLKKHGRSIPDTYKDTILACHEFAGDIVLKVASLVKHRNEAIHQYLKINWQNIVTVKNKIPDIREFIDKVRKC
ncbi:MAG: HepT-like ribonuclease domain-containing protein [Nitrospirota bacterium]